MPEIQTFPTYSHICVVFSFSQIQAEDKHSHVKCLRDDAKQDNVGTAVEMM